MLPGKRGKDDTTYDHASFLKHSFLLKMRKQKRGNKKSKCVHAGKKARKMIRWKCRWMHYEDI